MQKTKELDADTARQDAPIFIVGAGRSGTTWLQSLIAQHPRVASAPETDLFVGYLSRLQERWALETLQRSDGALRTGLQTLLSEDKFYAALSPLVDAVFCAVRATRPGSTVVLDKKPDNVLYASLITRFFPQARFIHLIRDPRAVVASLRASASGWGAHWADAGALAGAEQWRTPVRAGLQIGETCPHYREIRYEALRAEPVATLQALFEWLALPTSNEDCRRYAEDASIEKLRTGKAQIDIAPVGEELKSQFFRRGEAEGWRDELSAVDIAAVELICGELMQRLGYAQVSQSGFSNAMVARPLARLRGLIRRLAGAVRWRTVNKFARIERAL